ncbi:DNA-directed_RNA polymerase subunit beta [Hexamita inflata]|uniref:DNA-directed RNA polymerase subunit beta n=1 Tax=Hexamita inflata TaxID=28002 RepID=A0AA86NVZ6_9EUKA|nr:DNA-directed RNA polymerase subunit beta [Hexamita inflata]
MTRVQSSFDKSLKAVGPRMLNASQWGICCPSDTPEGESVGLIKNLAVLAQISVNQDINIVHKLLFCLGVEDLQLVDYSFSNIYQVFLNGAAVGIHSNPQYLVDQLRHLRRKGKINYMTSIYLEQSSKTINIACDAGRPCRPLILIGKNNKSLVEADDIKKVISKEIAVTDLIKQGKMELIDVNEESNLHIALSALDLDYAKYTHMELSPMSMYGVVASLVPFPHHNQSPRNSFQCAMGKQALGLPNLNVNNRFDTIVFQLLYPQRPLVSSKITRYSTHYMNIPAGQNSIVAVTSFSGYDIEDAIIMNRASCDRGYGRVSVLKCIDAEIDQEMQDSLAGKPLGMSEQQQQIQSKFTPEQYADNNTHVSHSDPFKQTGEYFKNPSKTRLQDSFKRYHAIDNDGLAKIGSKIEDGDVVVNRFNIASQSSSPISAKLPNQEHAIVSRVLIAQSTNKILVKTMTRETRPPYYGDKFSSRHGQKGTVGLIVNQSDMPFSPITGMVPDQIMNPHGFPSRMTIGKMLELLCGKQAVQLGKGADGSLFQESKVKEVCGGLLERGFNYHGKDILMSGLTGMPCRSYVFEGPIYYQRLKHMVNDKMHARSTGPKQFLTRQPLEGRAKDGGLRLGEMEKDCFIAYGTAALLNERMVYSSDEFLVYLCEECGIIGYEGWCQVCKSGARMVKVRMPYAAKLMSQELMAMGILMRVEVK